MSPLYNCLKKLPVRSPMRMRVEPTKLVVGTPLRIINEETMVDETRLLCPECGRSFDSKAGVSLHRKSCHPVEYNRDVPALVSSSNVLWTEGELHVMASEEIRWWQLDPHPCGINEFIRRTLIHCTIDAIKGKRKDGSYRIILDELKRVEASTARAEADPPQVDNTTDLVQGVSFLMEALEAMIGEMNIDSNMLSFVGNGDANGFLEFLYPLLGVGGGGGVQVASRRPRPWKRKDYMGQGGDRNKSRPNCIARRSFYADCQRLFSPIKSAVGLLWIMGRLSHVKVLR